MRAFARIAMHMALALLVAMSTSATAFAQDGTTSCGPGQSSCKPRPATNKKKSIRNAPPAPKAAAQPATRPTFGAQEQDVASIPSIADARFWGDEEKAFFAALGAANGPWLALSGGGEGGAYGAGILVGWTDSGRRPNFSVITGVSTGALIAPYVFAGSKYDGDLRASVTTVTAADVFELGGTAESLLDTWPLKEAIAKRLTPELLADIAAQHRAGRRLFVVTTNLDAGRPVVWNMGAIASHGGESARKLFRDVLLASSAIPGVFPPVAIEVEANGRKFQEMHGDGTINAPFFLVPEPALTGSALSRLSGQDLYVMVNGPLTADFRVIDRDRISILGRSIALALNFGMRTVIARARAAAKRNSVGFHLAYLDSSFDHPWRGLFDQKHMQALFERGFERAKNGTPFQNDLP